MPRASPSGKYVYTSVKIRKDLWDLIRRLAAEKDIPKYIVLNKILEAVLKGKKEVIE